MCCKRRRSRWPWHLTLAYGLNGLRRTAESEPTAVEAERHALEEQIRRALPDELRFAQAELCRFEDMTAFVPWDGEAPATERTKRGPRGSGAAPLEKLLELGKKPLLGGEGTSSSPRVGPVIPPKELMSVMQWVLIQSRDMPPGTLQWWANPMREPSSRSDTELKELQRHVENGWSFPRDTLQLSPLSVTLFLLKCLEVLPTPLLPAILVQDAAGDAKKISSTLRSLPELSRVVLLTVLAFFSQLALRHGGWPIDFTPRLASSLMQAEPAPEPAVQLILALSDEVKAEKRFPPLETFKRHGT
ncbi:unnamed protein product [Durusdinium trenchii]|uniref:Rho-GAP domain-containing protein n=1 Tax=Durusdinium trenchii TaxID=1381693 RepID=A0ABP0SNG5_9DINO